MGTTELGKKLRKIRIDEEERLLDMARRLEKSAAFISAVETGKKAPPSGFEEIVINVYKLADSAAEAMRRAADRSRKAFTLEANTPLERDTAGLMARKMHILSEKELSEIHSILVKGRSNK